MKNFTKKSLGIMLLASVLMSPVVGFAKEKDKETRVKVDVKMTKVEKRQEKSCLKAFGHFFAKGWHKKNSETSISIGENCFLPFGIGKKFGGAASTTPDVIPPVVKEVVGIVGTSTIQVSWKTNEPSNGKVYFSLTSPVNTTSGSFVENATLSKDHLIKVTGLTNGTKYYLVIESHDASNNTTRSGEFSLTTNGSVATPDTTAPVISSVLTSVGSSTINVSWNTNESATSKVYYKAGTSIDISSPSTLFVLNNSLVTSHSISLPSLSTSTEYRIVVESKDSVGNTATSSAIATTTLAL